MSDSIFQKDIVITPELCDASACLSPFGAFTVFQALASEHAESLGVGGAAMAKRGEFWLTAHVRADFLARPKMMQTVNAKTWAEKCSPKDFRCYRSYLLEANGAPIVAGKTEWAILGPDHKIVPFGASGFPQDYSFPERSAICEKLSRFRDNLTDDMLCSTYTVRPTDIDLGQHMNNVAYVRLILDCFPATILAEGKIRSMEIHYSAPCFEGEKLSVFHQRDGLVQQFAVRKGDGKTAVMASVRFSAESLPFAE